MTKLVAKPSQRSEWSGSFEWSDRVEKALQEIFGYKKWRENQREIVNATMSGRDVFVTMPTGGGKSLCYQVFRLFSLLISRYLLRVLAA